MDKPDNYYKVINQVLFRQVPENALRILEIGCSEGLFGAALKQVNPERYVVGVEYVPAVAEMARTRLDEVYACDIQTSSLPEHLALQSFDCIVCGDVLEHLTEATAVLRKLLPYLKADGCVVSCIPNAQHFTVIQQLLSQNFQYHGAGLLDKTHVNLMTLPNMFKMFLDAGYVPRLKNIVHQGPQMPEAFFNSLQPVLQFLGVAGPRAQMSLESFQYVLDATVHQASLKRVENWADVIAVEPCTVAVAVNNQLQYANNVAVSPDLATNNLQHQVLTLTHATSMAAAWDVALEHAQNNWIVLVHQDVYLPAGWFEQLQYAWHEAEELLGAEIGVAGVAGVGPDAAGQPVMMGRCIDRVNTFDPVPALPAVATSLDELVLVFRKDRFLPKMHPELGFHFYGTDAVLQAQAAGYTAAVLDVPCFHNSSRHGANIDDEDLKHKAQAFYHLYQHNLPIYTLIAQMQEGNIVFN